MEAKRQRKSQRGGEGITSRQWWSNKEHGEGSRKRDGRKRKIKNDRGEKRKSKLSKQTRGNKQMKEVTDGERVYVEYKNLHVSVQKWNCWDELEQQRLEGQLGQWGQVTKLFSHAKLLGCTVRSCRCPKPSDATYFHILAPVGKKQGVNSKQDTHFPAQQLLSKIPLKNHTGASLWSPIMTCS